MNKIDKPGVYDIPQGEYFADPVVEPSASSSILKLLIDKSPRHAWTQHPRLNPDYEPENKQMFDLGSLAHALILGGADVEIIDAPDYKTKDARAQRDQAYKDGKVPALRHQYDEAVKMRDTCFAQLKAHKDASDAFQNGKPEQAMIWQEDGVWCRGLLDWMPNDGNVFYDLKTTGASANPHSWGSRIAFDMGVDIQAVLYRRGIRALFGIDKPIFRFVVIENSPPYALSVMELDEYAMEYGERRVDHALGLWKWCLEGDHWPGYPGLTTYIGPPVWFEKRQAEREDAEYFAREEGYDLKELMLDWQAPADWEKTE